MAIHASRLVHGARADAQAAAESDALSRAILQSAPDAVIVIDDEGRIDSVNPAAESLSGYSAAELIGRDVDLLMPATPRSGDPEVDVETARRMAPTAIVGRRREVGLRRRDGREEPVELSMSELKVGDRRLFVGIARDVAQRKQEEQELRTAATADTLTGLVNRREPAPRIVVAQRSLQREAIHRPLVLREERRHRRASIVEVRVRVLRD